MYITFVTELNTFSNGIKRFEIDGGKYELSTLYENRHINEKKMVQKIGNGKKKVVSRRQSNNSGIQRFNPVIGISTSQGGVLNMNNR